MRVPDYLLQSCELPAGLDTTAPATALRIIALNNHRAAECRLVHDALRHTVLNRRANSVK